MISEALEEWCTNTIKCENCPFEKECSNPKNFKLKCDTCWNRKTIDCKEFVYQAKLRKIKFVDCSLYIEDKP